MQERVVSVCSLAVCFLWCVRVCVLVSFGLHKKVVPVSDY